VTNSNISANSNTEVNVKYPRTPTGRLKYTITLIIMIIIIIMIMVMVIMIGLEVNAHKTKYMTMSRDQNARRIHSMKFDNSSIERVQEFKYLGTTLTNQNSVQEEIKSRLKLGNACYYSVQNLLSSRLLSKNLNIKIYV